MQDQPNPNSNPPNSAPFPFKPSHHRRAHSEVNFRLPEDLDLLPDPLDAPSGSFEDGGSEDDLFSTYINIEKIGSVSNHGGGVLDGGQINNDAGDGGASFIDDDKITSKPRHRHSNSVDSSSFFEEIIEAKKAMAPDKLAELMTVDPKRAKRILANRQSAARSKERKARYISDLERKVQTLQTEATTLSAQLALFQRDTAGLSSENTELKLRLQAMEQQAQLSDALNDALKQEVERLRIMTGEIANCSDGYNLGIHRNVQPNFFINQKQNERLPYHYTTQSNHHLHAVTTSQHDPLGRFQGLDINNRSGSHPIKSEGVSISTSESNSTF
ncbi:hypothetical protein E3N88_38658 [Mikania micrantha]|uniref:BZIP domain-containing protein n=1 Tax=Mikania micrantha TaxID=192012 RepID=A0A5N6LUN9_9ASTR|nr:hypothetical protein E3N88_38658 [Mikania micrantha]